MSTSAPENTTDDDDVVVDDDDEKKKTTQHTKRSSIKLFLQHTNYGSLRSRKFKTQS